MKLNSPIIVRARKVCSEGKGLNNFILLFGENTILSEQNSACYATLMSYCSNISCFIDNPFGLLSTVNYADENILFKYLKWVLQDSVWHRAFRTRSVRSVLNNSVVFHVKFPATYTIQAGIMLRYVCERPETVKSWNIFSEFCDPHLAFLIAIDHVGISDEKGKLLGFNPFSYWLSAHVPFSSKNITRRVLKSWKGRTYIPWKPETMSHQQNYSGLRNYWSRLEADWIYPNLNTQKKKYYVFGVERTMEYIPAFRAEEYVKKFIEINNLGEIYA